MKYIETFPIKQFNVDLYLASEKYLKEPNDRFTKYFLMVEKRFLQINYGILKLYLQSTFNNESLNNTKIGISLLTIDSETQGEVEIKQTQKGYKIDCLELTTQETKELYLQINKFIRNYERASDDKN